MATRIADPRLTREPRDQQQDGEEREPFADGKDEEAEEAEQRRDGQQTRMPFAPISMR